VLLLALALRLLLWSQPLHQLANDEVEYVAVARDLLAGRGWQFYEHYHWLRAPLYPLFLAGSLRLASGDLHRAALPNIALSVATVYLSYRLALALAGRRSALLAALLTTTLWTLATFASLYMSETLFTFLFTAGLLCLAQTTTDNRRPTIRQGDREVSRSLAGRYFGPLPCWSLIGCAGTLFGLATLTRSITLLFLPVVALWLLLRTQNTEHRTTTADIRRRILFSLLFVLCSLAVIAPWTIRNYRAYGRLIPVETGLSYNLWAFNEPREDQETIFRTLERIPNPADRSDYATTRGLARLREDPTILIRKLWPNWIYLWRVKPIEDRFIMENYYFDVDLPLFGAALIFDDALYLLIALAGVAGLAMYRDTRPETRDRETGRPGDTQYAICITFRVSRLTSHVSRFVQSPQSLGILWLLYVVTTVLLTHGEGRYRHFLFPVLIPFAAWALTRIYDLRFTIYDWGSFQPKIPVILSPCHLVIVLLYVLIGGTALVYYPWSWAGQSVVRGWHALAGDIAWAAGAPGVAQREYERAIAAQETVGGWLRLGDLARATSDFQQARASYRAARGQSRTSVPAAARLGDLLRASGDEQAARAAFAAAYIDQQWLVDWSWRELRPAPQAQVDVGGGLDFGYVGGVYQAEEQQGATARWTDGRALLRLFVDPLARQGAATPALLRLRLAAPLPAGTPTSAQVCAVGTCWPLSVGPRWRTYTLPLIAPPGAPLLIEIRSDTFDTADGRHLGVMIDAAGITPADHP
jgi:4-amino-4-deoxy-L-arabinose transferase-like glycosyltransferase